MNTESNIHQETIINEIKSDKKSSTFNFSPKSKINDEDLNSEIENNNDNNGNSINFKGKNVTLKKRTNIDNILRNNDYDSEISDNQYVDDKLLKRELIRQKSFQKKLELKLSIRHTIFIVMLWIGFITSLIIGMILHFPLDSGITASSILWTISFIFLIISIIFTYFYCRIRFDLISKHDEVRYLSYFPL